MAYLPELHIISRAEGVDLFPLTSAVVKMAIFEQKCSLANPVYRRAEFDINVEQSSHVECVVLLSKLHTRQNIELELEMSEMDLTVAESKETYEEIKEYAKRPRCPEEKEKAIEDALEHFGMIN